MEVSLLELFARGIPEGALFILASYVFSKRQLDLKRFVVSTVVYSLLVYIIRLLPIQYGINNILTVFAIIAVNIMINRIDIIKSIKIAIFIFIIQFICEGINIFILQYLFKYDLSYIFSDAKLKILYGIPSLIIFGAILLLFYFIYIKRKGNKDK